MLDFPCQTSIPLETKKGNLNLSTTISWSIWITSVELPLLPTMEVLPHTSRTRNAIVDSVSFAPELSSFPDAVEMNTSGTRTNDDNPMAPTPTMVVGKAEAMNATWRATMEDRCVIHGAGEWGAPDQDMAFFGVYDGHGGGFFYCTTLSSLKNVKSYPVNVRMMGDSNNQPSFADTHGYFDIFSDFVLPPF